MYSIEISNIKRTPQNKREKVYLKHTKRTKTKKTFKKHKVSFGKT